MTVWDYTPRQTVAFVILADRRRRRDMREQLSIQALAAQGDSKAIRETLKELDQ